MKLIEKLYSMGEEAANLLQRPFTVKKVKRGLESAIDSLDAAIVENEEKIEKLTVKLAKGDLDKIQEITEAQMEIDEAEAQKKKIVALRDKMLSDAPKEKKEE